MRKKIFAMLCLVALLLAGCSGDNSYDSYESYENYDTESETTDFYDGQFMVFARIPEGWGDVYLWAGAEGVTGMFPEFPGMLMGLGEDGIYTISVDDMFDHIIISANGGSAMTESIYCAGQDIWVEIGEASYTYSGSVHGSGMISAGGFTEPDYFPSETSYDQILDDIKQPDIRIVSEELEVMALLGIREDIPVKMEYGWDHIGLKEMSIQTYYDMNGSSDEEISDFIIELRSFYQIEFGGYGCVQVWDELRDAYVVLVVYCTDLQEPAYSRTAAYLFGGGDIPVDDEFVRMPTEMEAEAMGYCIKFY